MDAWGRCLSADPDSVLTLQLGGTLAAGAQCLPLFGMHRDLCGPGRSGPQVHRLRVESRRLLIRGQRPPPEPVGNGHKPLQVLVMEIDYGAFEREVLLPSDVDRERVNAEQNNGLLWIYLPLAIPWLIENCRHCGPGPRILEASL